MSRGVRCGCPPEGLTKASHVPHRPCRALRSGRDRHPGSSHRAQRLRSGHRRGAGRCLPGRRGRPGGPGAGAVGRGRHVLRRGRPAGGRAGLGSRGTARTLGYRGRCRRADGRVTARADQARDRCDRRPCRRRRTRDRAVVRPARGRGGRDARRVLPALGRAADRRRHGAPAAPDRRKPRARPDPDGARGGCRRGARDRPGQSRGATRRGARGCRGAGARDRRISAGLPARRPCLRPAANGTWTARPRCARSLQAASRCCRAASPRRVPRALSAAPAVAALETLSHTAATASTGSPDDFAQHVDRGPRRSEPDTDDLHADTRPRTPSRHRRPSPAR